MTTHEASIADRLARAAALIETTSRLTAITGGDVIDLQDRPGESPGRSGIIHLNGRPRSWGSIVAIAAAVGLAFIGGIAVSRFSRDTGRVQVASEQTLVRLDLGLPAPEVSELLPLIADPPAVFGEGRPARRVGGQRRGQWTSAAIAIPTDDGYDQPVMISILRGDASYLDDATPVGPGLSPPAFGQLVSSTIGPWTALTTQTDPMVTVSGGVEPSVLLEVFDALARAESSPDSLILDTTQLPDGYRLIVEPTALGEDQISRKVVADEHRTASLNEISDRVDPLLAAAAGGRPLQSVSVGTTTGWTQTFDDEEFGLLRSLVWSPEPGVVLELSVVAEHWTLDHTIALAEGVTLVTPDQWDLHYPQ